MPAQIRVKLWFGFEKDEKDWIQIHGNEETEGAVSTYAETVIILFSQKPFNFLNLILKYGLKYENQEYSLLTMRWIKDGLARPSYSDINGKVSH